MKCWRCERLVKITNPDFVACRKCGAVNIVPNYESAAAFKQKLAEGYFKKNKKANP